MSSQETPDSAHRPLGELLSLDLGGRVDLITAISSKGFEPGCWLRVDHGQLLDPSAAAEIVERCETLERLSAARLNSLPELEGELAWNPPSDGADAWAVISQSCDLVRDIREEPLVQLALLRQAPEGMNLPMLGRRSARWIPIDPTGQKSRYYVDLRVQAFIPKSLLMPADARQAIPSDSEFGKARTRKRFALRVGQRYSRAAIPTPIVEAVVEPISKKADARAGLRNRLDAAFSEWLLREDDTYRLIAVTPYPSGSKEFIAAEDLLYKEFVPLLEPDIGEWLASDNIEVVSLDDLLLTDWLAAWRLDLSYLTYGSKGDSESPEPTA